MNQPDASEIIGKKLKDVVVGATALPVRQKGCNQNEGAKETGTVMLN